MNNEKVELTPEERTVLEKLYTRRDEELDKDLKRYGQTQARTDRKVNAVFILVVVNFVLLVALIILQLMK